MARNQTNNRKQNREPNPPVMIAYHVSDAGRGRKFWTRLGGVWEHRNGDGLTIFLNVLPVDFDGRIVLLPPREDEDDGGQGGIDETEADDEVEAETGDEAET